MTDPMAIMGKQVLNWRDVWDDDFEMFKISVTTKFPDRIVNYAQTVRELSDAGGCVSVRGMQRMPRIVHEHLTAWSRVVHDEFTNNSRLLWYISGFLGTARHS